MRPFLEGIFIGLILLGIILTVMNFFAVRGPTSEIIDSEIHEITPPPPPHRGFGKPSQPIALFETAPPHHQQEAYSPWRMGDWVQCVDGSQFYERNARFPTEPPSDPPCTEHGGLRAHGPGKRLNQK